MARYKEEKKILRAVKKVHGKKLPREWYLELKSCASKEEALEKYRALRGKEI